MNIGIIGCGVIGHKRAAALGNNKLIAVADHNIENAIGLSKKYENVLVFSDYKELLNIKDLDIVIVSTTNNVLSSISLDAINSGKHVLIEKPGATHYSEFDALIFASEKNNVKVKVGYNLRYHPAIHKAIRMVHADDLGEIMFVTGHYGNGGRLGFEKEWRNNKLISGGGSLIDLGCHLIDLSQCVLGNLSVISGTNKTYFWNMSVEDNTFMTLKNSKGNIASLQVSCTEWKNTFLFEIYGKKGKLKIEGLGGSYGTERLTYYKMSPLMEIPETTIWEYSKPDESFKNEFEDFVHLIKNNLNPWSYLEESQSVLKIIDEIYKNNKI